MSLVPLALPLTLVLGLAGSEPRQEASVRRPVESESPARKIAELDALVAELLALSRAEGAAGQEAWLALQGTVRKVNEEAGRRAAAERAAMQAAMAGRADGSDRAEGERDRWIEDARQLADRARREQAIAAIAAALGSGAPGRQRAACEALAELGDVKFEKEPFREPLLAIARASQGTLRIAALCALYNTARRPEDLALALAVADDPDPGSRRSAAGLIQNFSDGDLTGAAGAAVARLLASEDPNELRMVLGGIWGARVSPEIEARLLTLARSPDRDVRHNAIYFGLSTLEGKSAAVIEELVRVLEDPDHNNSHRALWGLGFGVPDEHAHLVVAAMKAFFEARSSPDVQKRALRVLGEYASADDLAWLRRIADDAAAPEPVRAEAREAIESVLGR